MELTARRRVAASVLPWALCGLSFGIAAGFIVSEMLGAGGHRRIGRLFRTNNHRPHHTPKGRSIAIARVREALEADPSLKEHVIEVRSRGHRGLELRGWVTTRAARTQAHRIARSASGELEVANRLLVRGEDVRFEAPVREDVPRPA
jgi:hypothetical protein